MFEYITGRPLFVVDPYSDTDDDHFLRLFEIIGSVPQNMLSKWTRAKFYFNSEGKNIKNYIGELPKGFDPKDQILLPPLEEFFDRNKPAEMSDKVSDQIKHLLRWILQYDATKRPSASELLNHPLFSDPNTT